MNSKQLLKSEKKKPCTECPFKRNNTLKGSNPGGSHPFVYIGQSQGPFWLPCHMEKEYKGKSTDPKTVNQCAGAAIYRANIGVLDKMPDEILKLESDTEIVFASHAEFLSHYLDCSLEVMENFINTHPKFIPHLLECELKDSNIKFIKK